MTKNLMFLCHVKVTQFRFGGKAAREKLKTKRNLVKSRGKITRKVRVEVLPV